MTKHPYHLVDMSPWPMCSATGSLLLVSGLAGWFHNYNSYLCHFGFQIIVLSSFLWWRDVTRESTFQGKHSSGVEAGLRMGMILFILSEVCLFFSFFWAFFHSSLSPSNAIHSWPPSGLMAINPYEVPLLNTTLLLSSGASMTWAHMSVLQSKWLESNISMGCTVTLGIIFSLIQAVEYINCPFTMADSVYGSIFFVSTGFHGVHVLIGTMFITSIWMRLFLNHFSSSHHFGFEASAWYWHFVDVVWLFLFICVYWWGY